MSGAGDAAALRRTRRKARPERGNQQPRKKVQYTALDPNVRAPRHGWLTVARKEFADLILSFRFLVLMGILALAAGAAVYATAGQLRQPGVASAASTVPSLFLVLFAPPSSVAPQNLPSFIFLFAFLAPLLGITLGFDAVNGERSEGTLPRLLSQPIHRDDVINGKFVAGLSAIALGFAAIMLLMAAVGIIELGIIPDPESIIRLAIWWVIAVVYVGLWLAFALLCSVLMRRAAASALAAIAVWLLVTLFATVFVGIVAGIVAPLPSDASTAQTIANINASENLARLSPSTLVQEATQVILDPSVRTLSYVTLVLQLNSSTGAVPTLLTVDQSLLVVWPQVVALVALTVVAFAAGYISFMRQEVRA
jgi:ABC-2 type transport system permease protein